MKKFISLLPAALTALVIIALTSCKKDSLIKEEEYDFVAFYVSSVEVKTGSNNNPSVLFTMSKAVNKNSAVYGKTIMVYNAEDKLVDGTISFPGEEIIMFQFKESPNLVCEEGDYCTLKYTIKGSAEKLEGVEGLDGTPLDGDIDYQPGGDFQKIVAYQKKY